MKELFLIRHGKSSWELNVSDQDRPLNQRGISDAHLIGSELVNKNLKLDYVFSSSANRALHTATICLGELDYPLEKLSVVSDLYDFTGDKVIHFIKKLNDNLNAVLIFGHNHAFTYIANAFGDQHIENVPTSGFVHLKFQENNWSSITQGSTVKILFPKNLKHGNKYQ